MNNAATVPLRLPAGRDSRWQAPIEILLIFGVFFLHGATPVPDVNEAHYLIKAERFWNPEAFANDFYCAAGTAHGVYFATFGWLTTLGWSRETVVWVGRLLTWLLLAIPFRGLTFTLWPRRWWAVLAAELFVLLTENGAMGSEWIIGGVEAKGFAYALMLWGLQALVAEQWNRAWLLFGAATAFHPVVGCWAVACAGIVWLVSLPRSPLVAMAPGIAGGILLALPGLWFAAALNLGTDWATVREANVIQVYDRLPHHLWPSDFADGFISRHIFLWILFLLLWHTTRGSVADARFRWFVAATIALSLVGLGVAGVAAVSGRDSALGALGASVLKFYWFRMADIMVPLGVAILGLQYVGELIDRSPRIGRWLLVALIVVSLGDVVSQLRHVPCLTTLPEATLPKADRFVEHDDWVDVCRWAREHTPPGTVFLTPRLSHTFDWNSDRAEVVTWKNMPQDARTIVEWWRRMLDVFEINPNDPENRWCATLAQLGMERLNKVAAKYGAQYAIVGLAADQPRLLLEPLYANASYAVYRVGASKD